MNRTITFRYTYREALPDPTPGAKRTELPSFLHPKDDISFYQQLPNAHVTEEHDARRGYSLGDWGTLVTSGATVLTSTAFATIVKAWLTSRRRKIRVTNLRTNVAIEGFALITPSAPKSRLTEG